MTPTDHLQAGRELDAAVAQRVFGWTDCEWTGWEWLGTATDGTTDCPIEPYSTQIEAAWQVVERLAQRNLAVTVTYGPAGVAVANVFGLPARDAMHVQWGSPCRTAPLAICRAALAALSAASDSES